MEEGLVIWHVRILISFDPFDVKLSQGFFRRTSFFSQLAHVYAYQLLYRYEMVSMDSSWRYQSKRSAYWLTHNVEIPVLQCLTERITFIIIRVIFMEQVLRDMPDRILVRW